MVTATASVSEETLQLLGAEINYDEPARGQEVVDVPLSTAIDTTRALRHQSTADTPDSVSHVRGAGAFAFTDKEWKV